MARGPGRPRAEPSGVQSRRILDAARAAFTEAGYDHTTVSGIAERARVPRSVVYETVGDKEALLAAVADEVADGVVAALDERIRRPDIVDMPLPDLVRDDVEWFMETIERDPSIGAIVRLSGRLGSGRDDAVSRARRRIEDGLTQLHVDRARAYGRARGESARLLAVVVLSLVEAAAFRSLAEGAWPSGSVAAIVAEFASGGYLRVEGAGRGLLDQFDRQAARAHRADPTGDDPDTGSG